MLLRPLASRRFVLFLLFSLVSVAAIFYAIGVSAESPKVAERVLPVVGGPYDYECWIEQHCGTDPPMDIVGMGSHPSDEAAAKAEALANAEANCATSCFDTPLTCCVDANPVSPCILGPRYVRVYNVVSSTGTDQVDRASSRAFGQSQSGLRCEFFAVGADGIPLYAGSPRPTGDGYSLEQACEDAWNRFLPQVGEHGLIDGTLRKRVAQASIYRCYVRVVSKYNNTHYDQQVEGQDHTRSQASDAAQSAAFRLKTALQARGHTNVEIRSGERCTIEVNALGNFEKATTLSRHRCQAADGSTVIAARRNRVPAAARAAAQEAARLIADAYGGATYCQELPTVSTAAASGCVDCGDDSAKTGATEVITPTEASPAASASDASASKQ